MPLIGEDRIMWGSDYPHPGCCGPTRTGSWPTICAKFSESTQRKIVHDNVAALYNIN